MGHIDDILSNHLDYSAHRDEQTSAIPLETLLADPRVEILIRKIKRSARNHAKRSRVELAGLLPPFDPMQIALSSIVIRYLHEHLKVEPDQSFTFFACYYLNGDLMEVGQAFTISQLNKVARANDQPTMIKSHIKHLKRLGYLAMKSKGLICTPELLKAIQSIRTHAQNWTQSTEMKRRTLAKSMHP